MQKINFLLLFGFIALLSGCAVTNKPVNSTEFVKLHKISEVEGIYQNQGDTGSNSPVYLSGLIWPGDELQHDSIEFIEIRKVNDNQIQIRTHGKSRINRKPIILQETKLNLHSGRIQLKRHLAISPFGSSAPDNPFAGPYYEMTEIGLDLNGNIKYRQRAMAAGLVYLVIPVALRVNEEVIFRKYR